MRWLRLEIISYWQLSTPHPSSDINVDLDRQDKVAKALALLTELGYTGVVEDDLGKLRPSDEYEAEMEVMAEVRAYFQVAYKVRLLRRMSGSLCSRGDLSASSTTSPS